MGLDCRARGRKGKVECGVGSVGKESRGCGKRMTARAGGVTLAGEVGGRATHLAETSSEVKPPTHLCGADEADDTAVRRVAARARLRGLLRLLWLRPSRQPSALSGSQGAGKPDIGMDWGPTKGCVGDRVQCDAGCARVVPSPAMQSMPLPSASPAIVPPSSQGT